MVAARATVSLILPIYNEAANLRRNFDDIYRAMRNLGGFEIIITEDGSTDGSKDIAKELASGKRNVKLLSFRERSGRGAALKRAIRVAKGDVIGYMDIDLAVPLRYVKDAISMIDHGCEVVAGSRYRGTRIERSASRLIASKAYNLIVNIVTGSRLDDHQCGFKFWKRGFIKKEASAARDNHWFFDTEVLLDAQRQGLRVCSIPVSWQEHRESKVKADDPVYFIAAVIRYRMSKGRV